MRESTLSGNYFQNILEQPQALRDTVAALDEDPLRSIVEKLEKGALRGIVLTGMGASYHALQPLVLELVAHGIPAQRVETSELLYHAPRLLDARTLVLVASQSGQSVEIVRLVERAQADKIPLLGITNTPASPLSAASDALLLTRAGSEYSVSSKTFVATLAALAFAGAVFTRQDPAVRRAQLVNAAEAMEQYLTHAQAFVAALEQRLKPITQMVLVGRGPSLAAVGTGALIQREAAHFPAQEMSSAAFRHGPMEMISPQLFVLVFRGIPPTVALNARLVQDIRAAGADAALIDESAAPDVFALPPIPPAVLPLLEILVPEMISLALARLRGRIPGEFERGTKITTTE